MVNESDEGVLLVTEQPGVALTIARALARGAPIRSRGQQPLRKVVELIPLGGELLAERARAQSRLRRTLSSAEGRERVLKVRATRPTRTATTHARMRARGRTATHQAPELTGSACRVGRRTRSLCRVRRFRPPWAPSGHATGSNSGCRAPSASRSTTSRTRTVCARTASPWAMRCSTALWRSAMGWCEAPRARALTLPDRGSWDVFVHQLELNV